jgi:hypothetical protein
MSLSFNRVRSVRALILTAVFLLACSAARAQTPIAMTLQTQPSNVPVGTPTQVSVSVSIPPSAALIRTGVLLYRYDENNRAIAQFGTMYDDGSHGDAVANDSIFTTQIVVNEPSPSALLLRASVAYLRQIKRELSDVRPLPVVANVTVQAARSELVAALQAGNLAAAYAKFSGRLTGSAVLNRLSAADRQQLITALSTCVVIESDDGYEVCEGHVQEAGANRTLQFTFLRDALGVWRVLGW